uniref:TOG domain-containing protein n=1 Tax=Ananas comosus var. bracteatus TaxID=296719 RepID=A0A6V7PCR5_ANACO|nr:unnamed protein product [Ananas comosus var. bracteatus]
MAGDGVKWDGLLKWSLSHSDGTRPPRNIREEDRRWFMEAMQAHAVDVVKRMREITMVMRTPEEVLEAQGVTPSDIEGMLDELHEHVEAIDMANDLHSVGGLVPLLGYLRNSNASIRGKAAEVVSTVVQNNPRSQQLVMEASGFEPLLLNFTSDPDITVRTKALGAISCLIRNYKAGTTAFRLANPYSGLRDALSSNNTRFQRKALNLIQYLVQENSSDCSVIAELGFPRLMIHLASSDDLEVREAALGGLLELARDGTAGNNIISTEKDQLSQLLQNRIDDIRSMSPDDLRAAREERQLVDSLWSICYNEPSVLRKEGLVVLSGRNPSRCPQMLQGDSSSPLSVRGQRKRLLQTRVRFGQQSKERDTIAYRLCVVFERKFS